MHFIFLFYSILFTYLYTAPLTEAPSSAISPRKKKGLKKARSRGQRARKNLSTGFYRETIPQERTSWEQKHTAEKWTIRDCREWPHNYYAKIARIQAQKRFINKEDTLKVNPCRKRKPMELFCHESRYMRESRNAGNQTSSRIKDRLQWSQAGFW